MAASSVGQSGSGKRGAGKFLTFCLGPEEYGMQILKVQEIIGLMPVTPVPNSPIYIRGVINLRGKIVPVLDLRSKLDMPSAEPTSESCIIVVRTQSIEVGVIVDRVREVLDVPEDDVEVPPDIGIDTTYLLGIGKTHGRVKLLLDIDRVLESANLFTR
jgi:purine-binding chemotaxis protein CheW